MSIFARLVDERFIAHRNRSTSLAGKAGALLAVALFWYHLFVNHVWNWDLLAVAATIALVKIAVLAWYLIND
jgi:hypothetical protein